MMTDTWFEESLDSNEKRSYRIVEHIYRTTTAFHEIEVVRLANHGITLIIDGHARVFESDEFIYHEALVHPSMHIHTKPRNVLVIGDGDGGSIRELLKYSNLSKIDWVEIDKGVFDICKTYLPSFPEFLRDKRLCTYWKDGMDFVRESDTKYDIVLVSVSEVMEDEIANHMYELEALQNIERILAPDGICIQSSGIAAPGMTSALKFVFYNFQKAFSTSTIYTVGLPALGINWGFCVGTDSHLELKVEKIHIQGLRFYDKATHYAMFTLPSYLESELKAL
jgi:spermidine synthase